MENFNILYTVMKMLLNFIESNKEINCQPRESLRLKTVIIYAKQNYSYFSKIYGRNNLLEFWYSCLSLFTSKTKKSKTIVHLS